MRIIGPGTMLSRWLRRNVNRVAPFTHFIPKLIRQRYLDRLFDRQNSKLPRPLSFEKGVYPDGKNN